MLTISRRLGHCKASITLDIYGHLVRARMPEQMTLSIRCLENSRRLQLGCSFGFVPPATTPKTLTFLCGEVPEWSNGTVSKTVVRVTVPWVRIPPSPPIS